MPFKVPAFLVEPPDVYRSKRSGHLTSHQVIDFRHCPLLWKQKQAGLIAETIGEHYLVGAATHCLTLEGREEFNRQYLVGGPINPKTDRPYGRDTKAYAEWEAQQSQACLSDDQYALVCQLQAAVKSHSEARKLLATGVPEGVLRTEIAGTACQIRCDWFSPDAGLIDLKTCANLDQFERDAELYHYVAQMAFYRDVIYRSTGEVVPVFLIGVEKQEPYRVGIWLIDPFDLCDETQLNLDAIDDWNYCQANNVWPTRYERVRPLRRVA